MILIKHIDVVEFADSRSVIIDHIQNKRPLDYFSNGGEDFYPNFTYEEIIWSEKYTNLRGEEVVIGLSNEARHLIGLPLKAVEDLRKSRDYALDKNDQFRLWIENLEKEINKLKTIIKTQKKTCRKQKKRNCRIEKLYRGGHKHE